MQSTTAQVYGDLIDLCNTSGTCPHVTLSHVCEADETAPLVLNDLLNNLALSIDLYGVGRGEEAIEHASHVLALAMAVGYSIGAGDAYAVAVAEEVTVPDTLAGMDFLGDR